MRRFESFHPCQNTVLSVFPAQRTAQASRKIFAICKERPRLLGAVLFFTGEKKHFPVRGCVSHQNFLRCSFVHAPTFQRVKMISDSLKVFSGNANPKLAHAVAQYLNIPLGRQPSTASPTAKLWLKSTRTSAAVTLSCFKAPVRRPMTI